jgi:transcriptional activator SPT8
VNGAQAMTAQQRSMVGLGEGVSKAGVARGWWANEVSSTGMENGSDAGSRREPVYSLACEGDGLWALTGTKVCLSPIPTSRRGFSKLTRQSGAINLYTLRHSPGHHIHTLKGHTNVVSCLSLLPSEKGFISGSWDGSVRVGLKANYQKECQS